MAENLGDEERQRNFMQPLRIDSSEWNKKVVSVPLRKILVQKVSDNNFVFYQDWINFLVSWITVGMFIYQQNNIKTFATFDWFMTYEKCVHCYFSADFTLRLLCAKYPRITLMSISSMVEIITTVPFLLVWIFGRA